MKSKPEDWQLWEQRINDRNNSGLTIEKWCKENNISRHKYNYWNHKIKEKNNHEVTFAEVTPIILDVERSEVNVCKSDDFQLFFNNIQVTIPSNFNKSSLADLMEILQNL